MGRSLRRPALCSEDGMADDANGTEATAAESPQSRLIGAGFHRRLQWWVPPGEERAMTLEDAIAALDAGEVKPFTIPWPGVNPDTAHHFQRSEEEVDRLLGRNQPPPEPPPLPSWAAPWAELIGKQIAEHLRPIVRAEVRAALKVAKRSEARPAK
jgi:hypothetical protein